MTTYLTGINSIDGGDNIHYMVKDTRCRSMHGVLDIIRNELCTEDNSKLWDSMDGYLEFERQFESMRAGGCMYFRGIKISCEEDSRFVCWCVSWGLFSDNKDIYGDSPLNALENFTHKKMKRDKDGQYVVTDRLNRRRYTYSIVGKD